jgi:hypothetical protein
MIVHSEIGRKRASGRSLREANLCDRHVWALPQPLRALCRRATAAAGTPALLPRRGHRVSNGDPGAFRRQSKAPNCVARVRTRFAHGVCVCAIYASAQVFMTAACCARRAAGPARRREHRAVAMATAWPPSCSLDPDALRRLITRPYYGAWPRTSGLARTAGSCFPT